jgi:hypothetical protein
VQAAVQKVWAAFREWLSRLDGDGTYQLRDVGQMLVKWRRIGRECEDQVPPRMARIVSRAGSFVARCAFKDSSTSTAL